MHVNSFGLPWTEHISAGIFTEKRVFSGPPSSRLNLGFFSPLGVQPALSFPPPLFTQKVSSGQDGDDEEPKMVKLFLSCAWLLLQRLEGPDGHLNALVNGIKKDKRHKDFVVVEKKPITNRTYGVHCRQRRKLNPCFCDPICLI